MADYLTFAGGIIISDTESSNSEGEANITDLTVEEEPEVRFNPPTDVTQDLATNQIQRRVPTTEPIRKRPRDVAPNEEELIEGSGLYIKHPRIAGCPDMRKFIVHKMIPPSLHNSEVRDQYAESLHLLADMLRWMVYSQDDLPNAVMTYALEVRSVICC